MSCGAPAADGMAASMATTYTSMKKAPEASVNVMHQHQRRGLFGLHVDACQWKQEGTWQQLSRRASKSV